VRAAAHAWEKWIADRKTGAAQKSGNPKRIDDYREREKLKLCTAQRESSV
jgi:hypothetical protein